MADDYKVGYGRPPKHGRFKKGQSGNPRGRPKGTPNLKTAIANVMKSKVAVRIGDQTLRMYPVDALARKLFQQALRVDSKALKILIEYGGLSDAFTDSIQKSTPFAPEDHEIVRDAYARLAGKPNDDADESGGNRS